MKRLFSTTGQSVILHAQDEIEARLQVAYPGCKVVKRAVGGSSIESWQRGRPNYELALVDIKQAISDGFVYSAHIFFNGQTDAKFPLAAAQWKKKFWDFSRDLRADAGAPYIPVISGQLGKLPNVPANYLPGYTEWEIIREQQRQALYGHGAFVMFDTTDAGEYEYKKPYCHYLPGNRIAEMTVDAVMTKVQKMEKN